MPGFNPLSSGQNGGSAWDPYNLARNTLNNAGAKADTGFNPMGRTSSTNGRGTAPAPNHSQGGTAPAPDKNQGGNGNFDYGSAGLKPQEDIKDAASKVKDQVLTQKDFLLLLTTQLQAQDPTKPADNNQLVSQMSQLSMVESLNSINSNMDNVLSSVGASSAMNATNLIGTYVYTDKNQGYFGGSPSSPALWSIDAGDETYSDVKLTIKDSVTGQVVYTDTAESITGEIKYAWPGILSPDGPVKPESKPDAKPEGKPDGGTTGGTGGDKDPGKKVADAGTSGSGSDGKPTDPNAKPESKPDGETKPEGEENKYTYCNPGRYVIEVTGTASNGQSVNLKTKGLGFVSSVTLGKTLKDTMLNLSGLGEMSFEKANRVTL